MSRSKPSKILSLNKRSLVIGLVLLLAAIVGSLLLPDFFSAKYDSRKLVASAASSTASTTQESAPIAPVVTHVKTPAAIKALYMTSWVAGTGSLRDHIIKLLDTTEANAVVVDIKDYTGHIAFKTGDPSLDDIGCTENRISDIRGLIDLLHSKGIYVIGRVAVFQDPCYIKVHPEVAVKRLSDGGVWKDRKGISWVDAGSKEAWDHIIETAKTSYDLGFDEINLDYIRYPTDGNMKDISFPASGARTKATVIGDFFQYLDQQLRGGRASSSSDPVFDQFYAQYTATSTKLADAGGKTDVTDHNGNGRLILSADLFGLVTVAEDDLGIGQTLSKTLPYVDYIDPMVYPSHFANGSDGFKNPADHPYEIIQYSMGSAVKRAKAQGLNPEKLRPWLQYFNLGATYDAAKIRAQIQATYDVGLTSWLMWDPNNKYSAGGLQN